jgi:hypothetical protein
MSVRSLWRITPFQLLAILLALTPCQGSAAPGDDVADAAPLHAHGKRYGKGWECDWGYRTISQSCVAIDLPTTTEGIGKPMGNARRSNSLRTPS